MLKKWQSLLNSCIDLEEDYQRLMIMHTILGIMKRNKKELEPTYHSFEQARPLK